MNANKKTIKVESLIELNLSSNPNLNNPSLNQVQTNQTTNLNLKTAQTQTESIKILKGVYEYPAHIIQWSSFQELLKNQTLKIVDDQPYQENSHFAIISKHKQTNFKNLVKNPYVKTSVQSFFKNHLFTVFFVIVGIIMIGIVIWGIFGFLGSTS